MINDLAKKKPLFASIFISAMETIVPLWVSNITLQMDNAATNKNRFVVMVLGCLIKLERFVKVDISFMLAGHTKVLQLYS